MEKKQKKQIVLTVKTHQFHEATPLSISKVPKGQPKLKMFQPLLGDAVQQSPPGLDGEVPRLCFKHRGCVAILEAKTFVLVLQVVLDIEFGVFLQKLGPMEVACSFAPIDGNLRISRSVDNPYGISSGLRTICHESFQMRLGNSMLSHDMVEVVPKKHLNILVLGLEVATSDGHGGLLGSVVYVASHGEGHLQVVFCPTQKSWGQVATFYLSH